MDRRRVLAEQIAARDAVRHQPLLLRSTTVPSSFVLLDVSMRTIAVINEAVGDAPDETVFGPFFVGAPLIEDDGGMSGGATGEPP